VCQRKFRSLQITEIKESLQITARLTSRISLLVIT
jgi:hypothetical protein